MSEKSYKIIKTFGMSKKESVIFLIFHHFLTQNNQNKSRKHLFFNTFQNKKQDTQILQENER